MLIFQDANRCQEEKVKPTVKIGVVVNPAAGLSRGASVGKQVLEKLATTNHQILDLSGKDLQLAKANVEKAIQENLIEVLILVGGDGMAQLGAQTCVNRAVAMALVPAGTGNDAAGILGMPLDNPMAALDLILGNLTSHQQIDAVSISHDGKVSIALGSASAGFDALVNARANKMSWPKGPNRYYVAMLLELAKFKPIKYKSVVDGVAKDFEAMLCVVSNTGVFGGGMLVVPDASVLDGQLDILLVKRMSRLKFVTIFPKVYKGTHVTDKDVEIFRARSVRIEAEGLPIYSDGEYVGQAPFEANVLPAALKVISASR